MIYIIINITMNLVDSSNNCNSSSTYKNLPDYERRKIYFSSLPKNISVLNLKLSNPENIHDSIRGGVVPVFRTCISNGNEITYHNLYFLTRHSKAMLSDFGGLINRDENLLKGCYREFAEETFEYSMFIPRSHCVMLNSTITSVIFNSTLNTEILKKIHNHDYYDEIKDCKNIEVEFLKAYQVINTKIWNFHNIRLLYNEHRKVKQTRGESCNEIEGIVVLSDFLKIIQNSERQQDEWTIVRNTKTKHYGIETKSNMFQNPNSSINSNSFKIFSPIKKLVRNCSISDINKIHSHVSTYNISDKFEKIAKNYNIDVFSKLMSASNSVNIQSYKNIESIIGLNLHNHILYLNCIYSNNLIDLSSNHLSSKTWHLEKPKIHIMDIVLNFFKYIIFKYDSLFCEFDIHLNSANEIQMDESISTEIKIMACIIVWLSYYIEHINRINRSILNNIFEKHTELLKKLPNMTFKETYHWMTCLKLSSLKQTMYDINYPVEYVIGKLDDKYDKDNNKSMFEYKEYNRHSSYKEQEEIIKQYNREINYVSNYCIYNLKELLKVFCKEDTVNKIFHIY